MEKKKLYKKLKTLKKKRPQILALISEARKFGDLKENAEYHAAKEEQIICENKIKEIEHKLLTAYIINIKKIKLQNKIIFGSKVTLINLQNNNTVQYQIVGDDEANIKKNKISINSPLSQKIIGKKNNKIVSVQTPNGKIKYKIINIQTI